VTNIEPIKTKKSKYNNMKYKVKECINKLDTISRHGMDAIELTSGERI